MSANGAGDGAGLPMLPDPVSAPPFASKLLRRIREEREDGRHREIAIAIATPETKFVRVGPRVVQMAAQLRQTPPHDYIPLFATLKPPAPSVFLVFERADLEYGVHVETLPHDLIKLRHICLTTKGDLLAPWASSVLDFDAHQPFVKIDELPCGPAGPTAEANRIWMTWFHSIAFAVCRDHGMLMEEQRRRWTHWLLNDLALLSVAFSDAVAPKPGWFEGDRPLDGALVEKDHE